VVSKGFYRSRTVVPQERTYVKIKSVTDNLHYPPSLPTKRKELREMGIDPGVGDDEAFHLFSGSPDQGCNPLIKFPGPDLTLIQLSIEDTPP
jgi:hypothetical protein